MHACAGIYNKFSFLRFHYGSRWETPFVGKSEKGSFVLLFELSEILDQSPLVSAGTSLMSFNLLLRPVVKFYSVRTPLMRNFDLNLPERRLYFLGCLHDAAKLW